MHQPGRPIMLAVFGCAVLLACACQTAPRATARGELTPVAPTPRIGSALDFVEVLERSPHATWSDLLAGAALMRGVALGAISDDAALMAHATALGLTGDAQPDLRAGVRVLDVSSVISRALGEPVTTDAEAHRALVRQRALGIWPGPREAWEPVSGAQLVGVLGAADDHLARAAEAANMTLPGDHHRDMPPGGQ